MDFEKFLLLLRALEQYNVDYALVGGLALNLHGIVRATEDIDLFIRPEPANVDQMKKDTVRPIDKADSAMLKDKFSLEDEEEEEDASPEIS